MLVLSRREGEVVHIGQDITVQIVRIERGKVRIGIDAPKSVRLLRAELKQQEDREHAAAQNR